ncbi:MAG: DapH/DapD/GlmU-related protein [Roseibacillus sp.]
MKLYLSNLVSKLLVFARKCEVFVLKSKMDTGCGVIVRPGFKVTHPSNVQVGDDVYINSDVNIMSHGSVRIGARSIIAPRVQIISVNHDLNFKGLELRDSTVLEEVDVGEDVWLGAGAILLPGVSIGNNSVVGAGSVVTKTLPENVIAVGNPCRVIRARSS